MHQVRELALKGKSDSELWRFARRNQYAAILTADVDFQNKVLELGAPPRVARIERCDFSAKEITSCYAAKPSASRNS
jgi:predicted nuclease of predicted toxin-antitoxin system